MLYIYGDSHANDLFNELKIEKRLLHIGGITMFRIGRDNLIVNHEQSHDGPDNIFSLTYGEIDCRCHIKKHISEHRSCDSVVEDLVRSYFTSIQNNIKEYKRIIISAVIPPIRKDECTSSNEQYPFMGTDAERIAYASKVNAKMREYCSVYGYIFFDPYDSYKNADGTLMFDKSDKIVHVCSNHNDIIESFIKLLL